MPEYELLNHIHSPADLNALSVDELYRLCDEIRDSMIHSVSKTGGHLASNLGVVELTVALHKVFDAPVDKFVWDVGHQCYTHKMLTGRLHQMDTIRTEDGLSGFPKRHESEYDNFDSGHSSTSISAAFGLCNAKQLQGEEGSVVAVIGDGALSGGLAYEGLNNAGRYKKNFIVVLNDNKMSISKNVGSMARYLSGIRISPRYLHFKSRLERFLLHIPLIGRGLRNFLYGLKNMIKNLLYKSTIFEDMGFVYYGPYDGHDIDKMVHVFSGAKKLNHPVLIHVMTKKGKGYPFAEKDPKNFHGVSPFDVETGETASGGGKNFSSVFGEMLCCMAEDNPKICAITAAMKIGTGLSDFGRIYKDRFFDVGIAEEHAVTFAGGLAVGGMVPVFAVYSSFLQRGYDQIIHDVSLQNAKVVFAIDRAGIVGEDGETHQGLFDVPFFNTIPNSTVFSPCYYDEMVQDFRSAIYHCDGLSAVRYPRGGEGYRPADFGVSGKAFDMYGDEHAEILLITYGRLFSEACRARERLKECGVPLMICKLNQVKPIVPAAVSRAKAYQRVFFFEEGMLQGGAGEHFNYLLNQQGFTGCFTLTAVDDSFVPQAAMASALRQLRLDAEGMVNTITME